MKSATRWLKCCARVLDAQIDRFVLLENEPLLTLSSWYRTQIKSNTLLD